MELMAYTAHILRDIDHRTPVSFDRVLSRYEVLHQRALKQGQENGYPDEDWQEAWFAVCAWTDEMLLCSEWPERDRWESRQLQRVYFQTMNGGEEFFRRLYALPPEKGEVREMYLYCLASGFKGRFFSPGDEKKLSEIYHVHLQMIRDTIEFNPSETLFPAAYADAPIPVKRRIWRQGFGRWHVIVIVGSLFLVTALFFTYRTILGNLVKSYFGGGPL